MLVSTWQQSFFLLKFQQQNFLKERLVMMKLTSILSAILLISGCATFEEVNYVLQKVDTNWSAKNNEINNAFGSKVFDANKEDAFNALVKTVEELGFTITENDRETGYILAQAAAPIPLTEEEWQTVVDVEQPGMRSLASDTLPISSFFLSLHTDGVEIHVNGSVAKEAIGSRVKFDYTMIDNKVMEMGFTPVQTPPPTAVRVGLVKAWAEYEKQLALLK
jgi:hypothetical protein